MRPNRALLSFNITPFCWQILITFCFVQRVDVYRTELMVSSSLLQLMMRNSRPIYQTLNSRVQIVVNRPPLKSSVERLWTTYSCLKNISKYSLVSIYQNILTVFQQHVTDADSFKQISLYTFKQIYIVVKHKLLCLIELKIARCILERDRRNYFLSLVLANKFSDHPTSQRNPVFGVILLHIF